MPRFSHGFVAPFDWTKLVSPKRSNRQLYSRPLGRLNVCSVDAVVQRGVKLEWLVWAVLYGPSVFFRWDTASAKMVMKSP